MISKNSFDEDHPDVATSCNNLASVYNHLGEYDQGKELNEKVLMIRKNIFSEVSLLQQVITTWHQCRKDWENTIKPHTLTKKH